jgi:CO/xanthine dehydrogenase Mo-binding subunit
MATLNVIGNPANHDQHSKLILTGKLDFAADRLAGRKFFGAVVGSTFAHGTITAIDTTAAMAEPGVKAVVTYKDIPSWSANITSWGQEVAGVVADDWYTAVRASSLVKVTYTPAAAVFDPDAAMQSGAALVGALPSGNTTSFGTVTRGDVNAGFKQSDVTITVNAPWTTTHQHGMLENHQALCWWVGDDAYVWQASQNPHGHKSAMINYLALPGNKAHFFTHGCGGGMGDRAGISEDEMVVGLVMSKKLNGAPVLYALAKNNNICTHTRQFSVRADIQVGAKNDGTLVAMDITSYSNIGRSVGFFSAEWIGIQKSYTIPNFHLNNNVVITNTPPTGAWREVGVQPAAMCHQMALDQLAFKLNMDPWALRMKNIKAADAKDQDPPNLVWGGDGTILCLNKVYTASNYASKWHTPNTKTLADGTMHGIAITGYMSSHGTIGGSSRGALVTITPDGKALINMGGGRGSSGPATAMVHIAAETLGMTYADVSCGDWGNTDTTLDGGMQAGSTFTASEGSAYFNAAVDARNQLFAAALNIAPFASITGITIADLSSANGSVFYTKDPTKTTTFAKIMAASAPIAGRGDGWDGFLRSKSVGGMPIGSPCNCNGSMATCAEVAVDTETGVVTILGLWNCVDAGRAIFYNGVMREVTAGTELQMSQAFFFGDVYDPSTGALIGSQYTESQLPTYMDIPSDVIHPYYVESDDAGGPYGAHGIGEPAVSNYVALKNAIFNATGVWVDPAKGAMSPNKVLKALGKA